MTPPLFLRCNGPAYEFLLPPVIGSISSRDDFYAHPLPLFSSFQRVLMPGPAFFFCKRKLVVFRLLSASRNFSLHDLVLSWESPEPFVPDAVFFYYLLHGPKTQGSTTRCSWSFPDVDSPTCMILLPPLTRIFSGQTLRFLLYVSVLRFFFIHPDDTDSGFLLAPFFSLE